jgi:hypothetical protein
VFANLAAFTKMVMDVEQDRTHPTGEQKERLTQVGLLKHFNEIGQQSVLLQYRPNLNDFYFDEDAASKMKRTPKDKVEHHPDDDDMVGCIRPPPGVDAHKLPTGTFDDWRLAEISGGLYNKKGKGKGKAPASS